jgi:hypothetical protein
MKAIRAQIVQMTPAGIIASEVAIEDLIAAMEVRGATVVGYQPERSGRIEYREEIQGQPRFSSFCGPMYQGPGMVRYEDAAANDVFST